MTIKKKYFQFFLVVSLVIIGFATFNYFRNDKKDEEEDKVFIQAQAIQTALGWGYNITIDNKIYIHQEFIPAIPGKHGFRTKEDALLVGRRVIAKMSAKQLPTITRNDLIALGIIKDSIASK